MSTLSAVQVGHYLGVTERTVRNMISRGELEVLSADPIRLDSRHVAEALAVRQQEARLSLDRLRTSPLNLARETREKLHRPYVGVDLPENRKVRRQRQLALLSPTAKTLFGVAALAATQSEDGSCRWCSAALFAKVLGTWAPESYAPAFAELFGQAPCSACGPQLFRAALASLEARVHPGRQRPPDPVAEAVAAATPVVPAPRPQRAEPVQAGDDGKGMVSRRLRDVRGQLKEARRRGDTQHALALQKQLQALTADAARVDGRPVSARPGMLRCGHALAANCACPRRASKRAGS